tara:strand:- start:7 stop:543 length:537 start_codon:yes stop_codon:yes gene_type:complete
MATPEQIRELTEKMTEERDGLLALLGGIDEERAEERPPEGDGEDGWSVKEQLSHLASMETSYRAWVQRALVEDNPDLRGTTADPTAYSLEQAHDATVSQHSDELKRLRAETLEIIAGIAPDDFERTATQQMFGELTVMQWLRSYYRHDRMHHAQIEGRSSDYQPRFLSGEEPDQRRRG